MVSRVYMGGVHCVGRGEVVVADVGREHRVLAVVEQFVVRKVERDDVGGVLIHLHGRLSICGWTGGFSFVGRECFGGGSGCGSGGVSGVFRSIFV